MPKLSGQNLCSVDLDVYKFTPRLIVRMETLHKPGIAIDTAVRAARVAVEGVITNAGAIQQTFAGNLTNNRTFDREDSVLHGAVSMLEQSWLLSSRHRFESQRLDWN